MTNTKLYVNELNPSTKIQQHGLRLTGHSHTKIKEPVSTQSLKHGRRKRRQKLIYTDTLVGARDIGQCCQLIFNLIFVNLCKAPRDPFGVKGTI